MSKGRKLRKYPGPEGPEFREFATENEWLAGRRARMQASEIATLFIDEIEEQGQTTYHTPYTLALEKIGATQKIFTDREKQRNWISHRTEEVIGQFWREYDPCKSTWRADQHTILERPEMPHVGATLDFMTVIPDEGGAMPLECKAAGEWGRREWRDGDVPLKFQVQASLQMAVTGTDRAVVFCLIGGYTPKWTIIDRDEDLIKIAIDRATEFMEMIRAGKLPPVDGRALTSTVLNMLHPDDNGHSISLPSDADAWFESLDFLKYKRNEVEREEERLKQSVKECMGENTYGETEDIEFSWKTEGGKPQYLKVPLNNANDLVAAGIEFKTHLSAKKRVLRRKEKPKG